jgi:Spy/CpxP family protein refolding chaperone
MPKKNLALLIVVSAMLLVTVSISAQSAPSSQAVPGANAQPNSASDHDIQLLRENIQGQRKQIVAANMPLTPEEATKFWPLYDQYRAEAAKNGDERWALIQDYAKNYSTMTDAQANEFIKREAANEQKVISLRMKYVPMFEKIISAKKTALFCQIDHRIDLMIQLQLASQIPMVDAK